MHNTDNSKTRSGMWITALLLALFVIVVGVLVTSHIVEILSTQSPTVIEIDPKPVKPDTIPTQPDTPSTPSDSQSTVTGNAKLEISDDKGVWEKDTEIEIFKMSYNENGDVTVDGVGDKLIAPGTSNSYNFSFRNAGNVPLNYEMRTEVQFSHAELTIPVKVRIKGFDGNYLTGSEDGFAACDTLNSVSDKASLSPKMFANYTLEWLWPFETENSDTTDAYDTMLGNKAVTEDITMTVIIHARAEADASFSGGGSPYTGDKGITVYVIMAVIALAAMVVLLFFLFKNKKGESDDE